MNQRDTLHVAFYTGGASLDILGGSPTQASASHSEAKNCTQTAHTSAFSSAHLVLTVIAAHLGGDNQYCWAPAAYINEKVEQVLGCSVQVWAAHRCVRLFSSPCLICPAGASIILSAVC